MAKAKATTSTARAPKKIESHWEQDARRKEQLGKIKVLRAIGEANVYAGLCFEDIFGESKREMAQRWQLPMLVVRLAYDFGIRDGLRPDDIPEFQGWLDRARLTFEEVKAAFTEEAAE
jgi:hypothetical protein